MINRVDKQIILKHWAGEEDLLVMISQFINVANEIFGSGMWRWITDVLRKVDPQIDEPK